MPDHITSSKIIQYLRFASIICILAVSLIFVFITFERILFPYGVNYGEAPIINQANRVLLGEVIYKNNFDSPPYIVSNYPPVYIYLLSFLTKIFELPFYKCGRLISLFSTVIAVYIVTTICYKLTKKNFIGAISFGLFLGHPYLISWSSVARVDLLALSLSLLGIYIILFHWKSNLGILLATVLFTASIYTRQSYLLAGPLGSSVWLLKNDRKKFYLFFFTLLLLNSSIFIYLNISTENGFFNNVVTANINEYSIIRLLSLLKNFIIIWPIVITFVVITSISRLRDFLKRRQISNIPNILFFLLPYIMAASITTLTIGKVGSDINYFLELIVALLLSFSLLLNLSGSKSTSLNLLYKLSILSQLLWILVIILVINMRNVLQLKSDIGQYEKIYKETESATKVGNVLSDDYLDMVVISGQQIYYQPFEYGQLFKAGIWNPNNLVMEIEEKKFPLIIIGGTELNKECCWPEPISEAILNNYDIKRTNVLLYITPAEK